MFCILVSIFRFLLLPFRFLLFLSQLINLGLLQLSTRCNPPAPFLLLLPPPHPVLSLFLHSFFFLLPHLRQAAHEHYTLDVFMGFYIATRTFQSYHTVAHAVGDSKEGSEEGRGERKGGGGTEYQLAGCFGQRGSREHKEMVSHGLLPGRELLRSLSSRKPPPPHHPVLDSPLTLLLLL